MPPVGVQQVEELKKPIRGLRATHPENTRSVDRVILHMKPNLYKRALENKKPGSLLALKKLMVSPLWRKGDPIN